MNLFLNRLSALPVPRTHAASAPGPNPVREVLIAFRLFRLRGTKLLLAPGDMSNRPDCAHATILCRPHTTVAGGHRRRNERRTRRKDNGIWVT